MRPFRSGLPRPMKRSAGSFRFRSSNPPPSELPKKTVPDGDGLFWQRVKDLSAFFADGKKERSRRQTCRRPAVHRTAGIDFSNPSPSFCQKKTPPVGGVLFWQRVKDLNPHIRSQSPLCYHYTNPLFKTQDYYTRSAGFVNHKFPESRESFFSAVKIPLAFFPIIAHNIRNETEKG